MRTRLLSVAMLLLPAALLAQIAPLPRRPGPLQPAPLPRQPEPIARAVQYQRMRVSVESYPIVSYMTTSGFTGGAAAWASIGAAVHGEYRLTPLVSATADITSAFAGGPMNVTTAELGTRIHRVPTESRFQPFADFRLGYVNASAWELSSISAGIPTTGRAYGSGYSYGWGGIAGAGAEYGLTSSLTLTTELLATHTRMTAHDLRAASPVDPHFSLTSIRYTLGLSYTPLRTVHH